MNTTTLTDQPAGSVVPTRYWHRLTDGRVRCDLCPRECKLHEGQRGLCFVRACQDGQVVLTTYGRSSGFCIDPIEKKPLYHFLPGTPVLSFGTAGCNLACRFCQNWDISKSRETDTLTDLAGPEEIAEAALRHGCRSVAFTYNDPVIFHEYAIDVAKACRARGLRAVAVTAGYVSPAPRSEFYHHMDAANVDLKAFTDSFYEEVCAARLGPVLDTLEYIHHHTTVWLEITTLLPASTTARRSWTSSPPGWRTGSGPTSRSTSPPSIPTGGCWTGRPRPRRSSRGRGRSRTATGCGTPTPATCTTGRGTPPAAAPAAPS
jgi:AmmeMemoRadiSam system radical SAM enzyme